MIKIIRDGVNKRSEIFSAKMERPDISAVVSEIVERVKTEGDAAVRFYTEKFDKAKLVSLQVTNEEIKEAVDSVEPEFIEILKKVSMEY